MSDNTAFEQIFAGAPLMAILRGMGVERSIAVATRAWDLGITTVEVPIQTPVDLEALEAVASAARHRGLTVGAGTVVTPGQVRQARAAGAAFTVSPGLDLDVVHASQDSGLPSLPGVATPTELERALNDGLTWVKAFPASVLSAEWFRAMRGPFPAARFVATGGMHAGNAQLFLAAGAEVVAVGSALEDDTQLPALSDILGTQ